jgi:hypothetical protein
MRVVARLLIAGALAFGSGCASSDWIDRTLVTEDVTGTWVGRMGGGSSRDVVLELEQTESTVKGLLKSPSAGGAGLPPGPIDGMVAGDVFRFRNSRDNFEAELTVSGEEMDGRASYFGSSRQRIARQIRQDGARLRRTTAETSHP